jgi:subtilisin family serine protease/subtilisin-like proprotein convertase family protein
VSRRLRVVALVALPGVLAAPASIPGADEPTFRKDRILVKPKAGVTPEELNALHAGRGSQVIGRYQELEGIEVVRLGQGTQVDDELAIYRSSELVEYAEPDYLVKADILPNDPLFLDGSLWGLHNTGQNGGVADADIDGPEGWDVRREAPGVVVAVIDTGIRYTHQDLAANVWTNPGETPGNGIDDDGNGYVDDVHGINAITLSGDPNDDHGHGTHVAGTIGAVGNNGLGVTGVAWRVQLLGCKFLNSGGSGSTSDAIRCVDYARTMGARIMSNSWGGGGFSQALRDAIAAARDAGIVFVAAAGNSALDNDTFPHYPSSYDLDNVVAVASTDRTDALSSFSNYGFTSVDLGAPGSAIMSTWNGSDSDYRSISGTSMATPHVSGVFALMFARFPGENYSQIINRVFTSVDTIPSLAGKCTTQGRVNLHRALTSLPAPGPTLFLNDVTVSEGDSGTTTAVFTVTLTPAGSETVTVDYLTTDGTAAAGSDYQAGSGTVTFSPGVTTQTITVTVNGDTLSEANETFFVDLLNPAGGAVIGQSRGRATIVDDDPLPTLSIDDVTVTEGHCGPTEAQFTVSLSEASGQAVSVNYATVNGSATSSRVILTNPATITIPDSGAATPYPSTINLPAAAGTITGVKVTLTGFAHTWPADVDVLLAVPGGRSVILMSDVGGSTPVTGVTLAFDDAGPALGSGPLVSGTYRPTDIGTGDAFPSPAPPGPYGSTLGSLRGLPAGGAWRLFVVDDAGYDMGSIAGWTLNVETTGGDFAGAAGTLTLPAGTTTQTVSVAVNGDTAFEGDETFSVNLSSPLGATLTDALGLGTIVDDDPDPRVQEDVVWTSAVGVGVSGNDLVKTNPTGWGDSGAVSTRSITSGDVAFEFTASETNTRRMAGLGTGNANPSYTDLEFGILLVEDGTVWIYESGASRGPQTTYVAGDRFRVAVEGGIVRYRKNGALFYTSAVAPAYPLIADTAFYTMGATLTDAVLVVDARPSISIEGGSVTEGNTGTADAIFTVSLSSPSGEPVTVDYTTIDGTAVAGSDYVAASGSLTFPPGTTGQTITVTVLGDTLDEANEEFLVTLSCEQGAPIGVGSAAGTIIDDDGIVDENVFWTNVVGATASGNNLSKPGPTGWGGSGAISTRSIASGYAAFEFTALETNTRRMAGLGNGDSHQSFNDIEWGILLVEDGTVWVYESGASRGQRTTYASGDRFRVEANSGFVRYFKNGGLFYTSSVPPTYPLLVDTALYSQGATIANAVISYDTRPAISISDVTVTEGDAGSVAAVFDVTLSAPSPATVTVSYLTSGGTASSGADFTPASGTLTFTPGSTNQTITVDVLGDMLDESAETFFVYLYSPVNATLADSQGLGTIVDDDGFVDEAVVWTNVVGAAANGNSLVKTATTGWGNAGAVSTRIVASGDTYLEFTATETNTRRMVGLGNGDSSQNFDDLEFGILLVEDGSFWVYESGASRGRFGFYGSGYRFRVAVESGVVRYYRNGSPFYTSTVTPSHPLRADTSLYTAGATVTGAVIGVDTRPQLSIDDVTVTEGETGTVEAVFTVALSVPSTRTVTVDYATDNGTAVGSVADAANAGLVTIPNVGPATPYPSNVTVGAVSGTVTKVTVVIPRLNHTFAQDIDVLLVNPTGRGVLLISDVGGGSFLRDVALTFDDAGPPLPPSTFASGTYRPTNLADGEGGDDFPSPAPAGPYFATLAAFNGLAPSGTWKLFVMDDCCVDSGSLTSGWRLRIETTGGIYDYASTSGTLTFAPGATTQTVTVAVNGDVLDEANESFLVNLSNPVEASLADPQGRGTIVDDDGLVDEPIVWTNVVGATPSGADLTKTAMTGWGNAGAISTRSISSGDSYLEFTALETNARRMVGFGNGDSGQGFADIEFGILLVEDGTVWVYESGSSRGQRTTYLSGDRFRVSVESRVATYWKNGVAFYTSALVATYPLVVDTALYSAGGTVANAVLAVDTRQAVSVDDVSVTEGHLGTTDAVFTVSLSQPSTRTVTVAYGTRDGSATAASDYLETSGSVVFPPGSTAQTVAVPVVGDILDEAKEHFFLSLTPDVNLSIGRGLGRGTIVDDDGVLDEDVVWTNVVGCTATGNNLTKTAMTGWGNAGAISTRSIAAGDTFVEFTANETNTRRMVGLANGDSSQSFGDIESGILLVEDGSVWVYESGASRGQLTTYVSGDRFRVAVESGAVRYFKNGGVFYASLVAPAYPLVVDSALYSMGATVADVVIAVDTRPAVSIDDVTVAEGDGGSTDAVFNVYLSSPSTSPVAVNYTTLPGTASAGIDYTAASGTVSFSPGETAKTLVVPVLGDTLDEINERFQVLLSGAANARLGDNQGVGTIVDDDGVAYEDVSWTNVVGAVAAGNDLTKNTPTMWGNSGAASTRAIASGDGVMEFGTESTGTRKMAGLGTGDLSQSFTDVDFGILLVEDGTVWVYESGALRGQFGTYLASDRFQVAVESGVVRYRKNGVTFYTSAAAPTYPLLVDTALYTSGAMVTGVVIAGNLQ